MYSIMFLQPPSPPRLEVTRDYAGGFGVATHVNRNDYGHGKFSIPYFSLMYSASLLREKQFNIFYLDAQVERINAETTIARIEKLKPDLIVAVVNLPSIHGDVQFFRSLKKRYKHGKLALIGSVCRVLTNELADVNSADFIIHGEPESILPKLAERLRDDKEIINESGVDTIKHGRLKKSKTSTTLAAVQNLPWPPYDLMHTAQYRDPHFGLKYRYFPMWASRGCSMPCSFYCPYPIGMGRTIRFRSSSDVVQEIAHLNDRYGITVFTFRDQLFSSKVDRAEEICDLLIEKKLKLRWLCETRFDMVTERLLRKMKKAGCIRIHFGLETGDPDLLNKIGKPGMKISTVKNTLMLTKKVKIKPMTHIIIGLPGESNQTIQATIKTLRELGIIKVSVNIVTPYPGTKLYEYAKKHGLLETNDWSKFTSFTPVMRTESMSVTELENAKANLQKNLLGSNVFDRTRYLYKNNALFEMVSEGLTKIVGDPQSVIIFLKRFFSRKINRY